jgi:hypothetical protein
MVQVEKKKARDESALGIDYEGTSRNLDCKVTVIDTGPSPNSINFDEGVLIVRNPRENMR